MHKIAAALLVVVASCEPRRGPEDEANVWKIAIAAEIPNATRGRKVVLESTTSVGDLRSSASGITEPFRAKNVDIPKQLVTRFLAANQSSVELVEAVKQDARVTLVTSAAARAMFRSSDLEDDWAAFYRKYEGAAGLFKASRPGFYRDFALLYVEFSCGGLCGEGHLLLLRRAHEAWIVQADVVTWIS